MAAIAHLTNASGIGSAAVVVTKVFKFQSYFDSTLLEKAILPQATNEQIVGSTKNETQVPCYGAGLHPSSQTPCAIQFLGQDGTAASPVYVLVPGQTIVPVGGVQFAGVRYGLPYGWLGGGLVNLALFQSPGADVGWAGGPEVIFHRARYAILQPTDLTAGGSYNNAPKNWPLRFPWTQALRGTNSVPQKGQAAIAITEPTRVLMTLRSGAALAANAAVRMIFQGTNDFQLDSTGAAFDTGGELFYDLNLPTWANIGTSGNLATHVPVVEYAGPIARLAADDGGVVFVDNSGGTLNGMFIDVVRYGKL